MLAPVLLKYLTHKMRLASVSRWYQSLEIRASLDWAFNLQKSLQFQKEHYSDQDVARIIAQNKHHLKKLLPCPLNKSYKGSEETLFKMIERATAALQVKQQ
jgi:hypothetical protein